MPNPFPNSSNVNVYDEWNKDWIDIVFDDVIRRWRKEYMMMAYRIWH